MRVIDCGGTVAFAARSRDAAQMETRMFESLNWRKPSYRETSLRYAADGLAQAADGLAQATKTPMLFGSLAAMAIIGVIARLGMSRIGSTPSRSTVRAARSRAAEEKAMPAQNGRRRRKRKRKTAAKS
jgi:hypothetical protein